MAKDSDIVKDALEAFQQAYDAENENRNEALDDLKFSRLGEQWPEESRRQREKDGRPCLTINRMPSFIRQVVNDSRQNKPQIKVHPVDDGSDPAVAELLSGVIRNIEVQSNADVAYDTAIENAVTMGFGYFRIGVDYAHADAFDLDITIDRIANPFTVYGDPYSTAADSSDWNTAFITELMTQREFKRQYPKADVSDFSSLTNDDKDDLWFEDDSVRVAEYWVRDEVDSEIVKLSNGMILTAEELEPKIELFMLSGIQVVGSRPTKLHRVTQHMMNGVEVLKTTPWKGRYIPIVPVYGDEVWVEGKRHLLSLIRHAKDAQRSYNYWRTSAVEKVALDTRAPWIGRRGTFNSDAEKWATANVRNHAYIEFDTEMPQRNLPGGVPAGDLQVALQASDDMKSIVGIHDASLGARSNETSGRAIMARQREGDVATFHFIDNMTRAIRHAGRVLVDLIPKVYDTPRMLRIMGEDGAPSVVPVNQEAQIDGQMKVYDLTLGKYDVTVTSGPSFTTRREEAAMQMIELLRAFPQAASVIGDLLAKNLDWPGADEIAKRLKALVPPQALGQEGQDPRMQQIMQQGQQMIQQLQSRVSELEQGEATKMRELSIKAFEAETKRMEAQAKAMQPVIQPTPDSIL